MKTKYTFLLLIILQLCVVTSRGQYYYNQKPEFLKANSKWFMNDHGLNMDVDPPEIFTINNPLWNYGANYFTFFTGTYSNQLINASDPITGELRFSVWNVDVYDRNNSLTPNGLNSITDTSNVNSSYWNSSCVIPFVNNPDKYYLFTIRAKEDLHTTELDYSIIDMNLNNGLGDIDPGYKNIPIYQYFDDPTNTTSGSLNGLLPIPGNNCDFWLITNNTEFQDSSQFLCFHIDENGVNTVPLRTKYYLPLFTGITSGTLSLLRLAPDRKSFAFESSKFLRAVPDTRDYGIIINKFDAEDGSITPASRSIIQYEAVSSSITDFCYSNDSKFIYLSMRRSILSQNQFIDFQQFYGFNINSDDSLFVKLYPYPYLLSDTDDLNALVTLKSYNGKFYYNVSKDTSYIENGVQYVFPQIENLGILSESDTLVNLPPISLPLEGFGGFPIDVPYPFYPNDTIPNVYLDTTLCTENAPYIPAFKLSARPGFENYVWNDGSVGDSKTITEEGKYWVFYKGFCNSRADTFLIHTRPRSHVLPPDTLVCEQRFPFNLQASTADHYLWFNNNQSSGVEIQQPGIYWLQYFKEGCAQTDSISVTSEYCPCHVAVPSAFTPNGDGLNDYFKPIIAPGCVPSEYALKVYNRWGQLVYSSFGEFDLGWNGQYKNGLADGGTYFYELKFKSRFLSEPYYQKGDFVLIR